MDNDLIHEVEILRRLANIVYGFIDLKPEHPLYHSIRKDIKGILNRLRKGDY